MTLNRYLFLAVGLAELAYGFASASSFEMTASPSNCKLWFQGTGEVAYQLGPIALRWRTERLGAGYSF